MLIDVKDREWVVIAEGIVDNKAYDSIYFFEE